MEIWNAVGDTYIAPFVRADDFRCPCCGVLGIDLQFLLDVSHALRKHSPLEIYATSGYRCPDYNEAVGGVKNSLHIQGKALDIALGPLDYQFPLKMALDLRVLYDSIKQTCHLESGPTGLWLKGGDGKYYRCDIVFGEWAKKEPF